MVGSLLIIIAQLLSSHWIIDGKYWIIFGYTLDNGWILAYNYGTIVKQ